MKPPGWLAVVCTSLFAGTMACGSNPTGPPESILAPVIESDGIAFDGQAIPAELIDRLAPNRVVVVGETHHLTEHREFMAALVRELHARGFRQLLMELPQMVDWLLVEYVRDGAAVPPGLAAAGRPGPRTPRRGAGVQSDRSGGRAGARPRH